ncbi:prostaglandin reductase 1-like isoform X2 [Agrilus planipennis]|uniref:15-oxoprostaglandin 13-reductase n=1 Tax=Agrilus planipennis TaxID=224129 RepID=A0A1W4X8Z6_AGRPL|nr:prostaglandin reductase 1-like isoform X2 [Agrilus planipennis]
MLAGPGSTDGNDINADLITESRNKYFPVGRYVTSCFGWRTHTISNGIDNGDYPAPVLLPELGKLPVSLGVGILGIPGVTAYFGILDICQPKKGETMVISGASSTVGTIAGQIAKIKGCTVIGITESDEQGEWITNELGFNYYINQKKDNLQQLLQKYAPNGVDCYFDNVGGTISTRVLNNMNTLGRVAVCGFHQNYSNEDSMFNFNKAPIVQPSIVRKQLRIQGYLVSRYTDWTDAIYQNLMWVQEGSLKYNELIIEGYHNMFNAFLEMAKDSNTSTVIVKVPIGK